MSLSGRAALITGAARGIGFTIARILAARGMRVIVNDQNEDAAQLAAQQIGPNAVAIAADITQSDQVQNLFARAKQEVGPLWLLVNNAGIFRPGSGAAATEADWDQSFAVDAKGVFLCSQAALRGMLERRAGRIVIVSSIAGVITRTNQIAYCAAKAAVIHFARCLAVETAADGVTVNCICPGMTDSEMLRQTAESRNLGIEDYLKMIPAHRLAEAEDHANTIAWLASEDARHVTGQVISVDGGQSLFHPVTPP